LDPITNNATGSFYYAAVPKVDADGHDIAGIRLPEVTVPVGTSSGWALRKGSTFGGKSDGLDGAEGAGQFVPFADTAAARATNGDSRQSLTERYPTRSDFVAQRTAAAAALKARRLILDNDATNYTTIANKTVAVGTNANYSGSYAYSW
jgi:hypothetical protein